MKIEIKNRFSGSVIFSIEMDSWKLAVEAAIKSGASLNDADLSDADLRGAYLIGADLSGAALRGAYLRGASLSGADLIGADLSGAYLSGAYLIGADLNDADLSDADLRGASLSGASLRGAYLNDADLRGASLSGADLRGAKITDIAIAKTRILPEGSLIGWKKCKNGVIVKLRIPEEAKRSHAFGRKCRAEFAEVLEVIGSDVGISQYNPHTVYRTGEIVRPDSFDENWTDECSNGIHFFITRIEAEKD